MAFLTFAARGFVQARLNACLLLGTVLLFSFALGACGADEEPAAGLDENGCAVGLVGCACGVENFCQSGAYCGQMACARRSAASSAPRTARVSTMRRASRASTASRLPVTQKVCAVSRQLPARPAPRAALVWVVRVWAKVFRVLRAKLALVVSNRAALRARLAVRALRAGSVTLSMVGGLRATVRNVLRRTARSVPRAASAARGVRVMPGCCATARRRGVLRRPVPRAPLAAPATTESATARPSATATPSVSRRAAARARRATRVACASLVGAATLSRAISSRVLVACVLRRIRFALGSRAAHVTGTQRVIPVHAVTARRSPALLVLRGRPGVRVDRATTAASTVSPASVAVVWPRRVSCERRRRIRCVTARAAKASSFPTVPTGRARPKG
jgi:hypothetical protein